MFDLVLTADACTSAMAFNANVAKLFWFVQVTDSNADNAMAWHETLVLKMLELLPQEIEPNMTIHQMGR